MGDIAIAHLEMRASSEERTGVEFIFRTRDKAELVSFAPDPKLYDISATFRNWLRNVHIEIHSVTVSERNS